MKKIAAPLLTTKQVKFVDAYVRHGNLRVAGQEAGYNPNTNLMEVIEKPLVRSEIYKRKSALIEKSKSEVEVSFVWKMKKLKEIVEVCSQPEHYDPTVIIRAIEVMNKMTGDNAPERSLNMNLNLNTNIEIEVDAVRERYIKDV
jgi:phage terminase small subunit